MSDIKFIERFGDELERMITADTASQRSTAPASLWTRLRRLIRDHRPLAIILVAVTVAGCATAVEIASQADTTTVMEGLTCMSSLNGKPWPQHDDEQYGTSPTVACANALQVPVSTLVACADTTQGIVVYERRGAANICVRHHLHTMTPADLLGEKVIHELQVDLNKLYDSRDCFPPLLLAEQANKILAHLNLTEWTAQVQSRTEIGYDFSGPCGVFAGSGPFGLSGSDLDGTYLNGTPVVPDNTTIPIALTAPKSMNNDLYNLQFSLTDQTFQHFYTLKALKSLIRMRVAAKPSLRRLLVKFTVVSAPMWIFNTGENGGGTAVPRQDAILGRRIYLHGGALYCTFWTNDAATVLTVTLYERNAEPKHYS